MERSDACLRQVSGLLLAPFVNLDASAPPRPGCWLSVGAAAIGAFSNLPLTYAGGLLIGVVSAVMNKYWTGSGSILAGLPGSVPFLVLFVTASLQIPRRKLVVRTPMGGACRLHPVEGLPVQTQIFGLILVGAPTSFRSGNCRSPPDPVDIGLTVDTHRDFVGPSCEDIRTGFTLPNQALLPSVPWRLPS